jgi:hypothetical protein
MTAIAQDFWQEQEDAPEIRVDGRVNAELEDAYWQSVYFGEAYYRSNCSYDDYAPAYCAGYIGFAQYGGCYEDAEKSLCANWLRIKGDSQLDIEEAMQAIRAAWDHAAQAQLPVEEEEEEEEDLVETGLLAARASRSRQPDYAAA